MPLDPNIPLSGTNSVIDFGKIADSALKGYQIGAQAKSRKLDDEQRKLNIAKSEFEKSSAERQEGLKSFIVATSQTNNLLDAGDYEGAKNLLSRRIENLQSRQSLGENVDAEDSIEALNILERDPEKFKTLVNTTNKLGLELGILKSPNATLRGGGTGVLMDRLKDENPSLTDQQALFLIKGGSNKGLTVQDGQVNSLEGFNQAVGSIKQAEAVGAKTGELQTEKDFSKPKVENAFNTLITEYEFMEEDINDLSPRINALTAGFQGTLLSKIPGTEASDLVADIETIVANLGFQKLQEMRNNSPTGGALGQVSELELKLLQSTLANVKNSQTPEQLKANFEKLKNRIERVKTRVRNAFENEYGSQKDEMTSRIIDRQPSNKTDQGSTRSGLKFKIVQ